jgi:hypothetical protein
MENNSKIFSSDPAIVAAMDDMKNQFAEILPVVDRVAADPILGSDAGIISPGTTQTEQLAYIRGAMQNMQKVAAINLERMDKAWAENDALRLWGAAQGLCPGAREWDAVGVSVEGALGESFRQYLKKALHLAQLLKPYYVFPA